VPTARINNCSHKHTLYLSNKPLYHFYNKNGNILGYEFWPSTQTPTLVSLHFIFLRLFLPEHLPPASLCSASVLSEVVISCLKSSAAPSKAWNWRLEEKLLLSFYRFYRWQSISFKTVLFQCFMCILSLLHMVCLTITTHLITCLLSPICVAIK